MPRMSKRCPCSTCGNPPRNHQDRKTKMFHCPVHEEICNIHLIRYNKITGCPECAIMDPEDDEDRKEPPSDDSVNHPTGSERHASVKAVEQAKAKEKKVERHKTEKAAITQAKLEGGK